MFHTGYKSLNDLSDILIVQKIEVKDAASVSTSKNATNGMDCACPENLCDCKIKQIIEDDERIKRKELQLLQADERGKVALVAEIALLREKQEQKKELLKNRQRALDIEKKRARKLACLPPPLPKSIRVLLKKSDGAPAVSKPGVEMPAGLTAAAIKPVDLSQENKENIMLDPEELETRQKMQEQRQLKARKRFNQALKKDRQKEEYSNIMKQIQNAELSNRREMAKNISSDKNGIPCAFADKFQVAEKQADMEVAAEKIFTKTAAKEHVIEDMEGYQDHYEVEYKKIDFKQEARMIDCIPSFVKENYDYLMKKGSKASVGKSSSGLDDSGSDILNEAYIETPPGVDDVDGKDKLDVAISSLDSLRSSLEEEYETLRPVITSAFEAPENQTSDKSVETDSAKVSLEDKGVGTDEVFNALLYSPPPTAIFDYKKAGVMANRKRPWRPALSRYQEVYVPDMHHRDVHYVVPVTQSEDVTGGSWSSPSSYCSLPSKHGYPVLPGSTSGSEECDICAAEKKKGHNKDTFPQEHSPRCSRRKLDNSLTSNNKTLFSGYVQQLAKKHLAPKSQVSSDVEAGITKSFSDSCLPVYSTKAVTSVFASESEKCDICNAETSKDHNKGSFPQEHSQSCTNGKPDQSHPSKNKAVLSEYVQQLARKHLVSKSQAGTTAEESTVKVSSDSCLPVYSTKSVTPAFEKKVISEPVAECSLEPNKSEFFFQVAVEKGSGDRQSLQTTPADFGKCFKEREVETQENLEPAEMHIKIDKTPKNEVEHLPDDIYSKIKHFEPSKSPVELSDYDFEVKRIQAVHEVLSRRIPRFTLDDSPKSETSKDREEIAKLSVAHLQNLFLPKSHEYHELSTIQEVDSALTASSLHVSQSEPDMPKIKADNKLPEEKQLKVFDQSAEGLKMISLLDPPDPEVSELARSIHFVPETEKKESHDIGPSEDAPKRVSPEHLEGLSVSSKKVVSRKGAPKTVSSESLEGLSVSSKDEMSNLSTPSLTSSSDSNPVSNFGSGTKIFSSTLNKEQANHSHLKDTKALPHYFKDVSGIQQKVSIPEKYDSCVSTPTGSSSGWTTPSVSSLIDLQSKERKDMLHSPASDYVQDSEVPKILVSDSSHTAQEKTDDKDIMISGYISDMDVSERSKSKGQDSNQKMLKLHSLMSGYISDFEGPEMTESGISQPDHQTRAKDNKNSLLKYGTVSKSSSDESFKPMTPQSNISSPSELSSCASTKAQQGSDTGIESFKVLALQTGEDISSPSDSAIHITQYKPQDSKSAKSFQALTLHSNISSPSESAFQTQQHNPQGFESVASFKALSPCSNISSPSESAFHIHYHKLPDSGSGASFKALTPQSNISSPSESAFQIQHYKPPDTRDVLNFKALTPQSNISSPSESAFQTRQYKPQDSGNAASFKTLMPQSNISSPSESVFYTPEYRLQGRDKQGFMVLTPCSSVSSPNDFTSPSTNEQQLQASSTENVNTLTPRSVTPSLSSDEIELPRGQSSGDSQIQPITLRFKVPADSIREGIDESLHLKFGLKANLSNPKSWILSKKSETKVLLKLPQRAIYGLKSKSTSHITSKTLNSKSNFYAQGCSSDFFIPSLNDDFTRSDGHPVEGSLKMEDGANLKSAFSASTGLSYESSKNPSEQNQADLTERNEKSKNASDEKLIPKKTDSSKQLVQCELEKCIALHEQHCNSEAGSSASSSTDNLSSISGSKVLCQSTPIKNFSELIQEPGILEEPDLTLVTTGLSCNFTETIVDPLTSITCRQSVDEEDDTSLKSNECKTPPQQAHPDSSVETPSMLSFLHHEISCMQTLNDTGHSLTQGLSEGSSSQGLTKYKTPRFKLEEVKRSLFRKTDYRTRTKRLWNNLEEVKKKNLVEERRQVMEINRKKAKEFAKKLTPKQRVKK